jgi:hypothetical protein
MGNAWRGVASSDDGSYETPRFRLLYALNHPLPRLRADVYLS